MLNDLKEEPSQTAANSYSDTLTEFPTRQQREAEFWNHKVLRAHGERSAADLRVDPETCIDPRRDELCYYSVTDFYRCGLRRLGDVAGKRVLDYGCGDGLLSVALAKKGAEVDAVDISPRSVELTGLRAQVNGVSDRIRLHVMDAQNLAFPDDSFDCVVGSFILHHVDVATAGREIGRVLIPGGKAFFVENSASNKLLVFARNHIAGRYGTPKYGSDDESPLTPEQIEVLGRCFRGDVVVRYPSFVFLRLLAGYAPLCSGKAMMKMLAAADHLVFRCLPPLRKYSYFQTIELRKATAPQAVAVRSAGPSS